MKFATLFFNAMRMTSKIDCRRFAVEPAYQQAQERELCGDLWFRHRIRRISTGKAVAGIRWGALPD